MHWGVESREEKEEEERAEVEKLFFELSSETRFAILNELARRGNLKTHEAANLENITATEAVRQLQRLTDALLIQRNPDASYALTEYGKTVLLLSRPLEFVLNYQDYFSTHDLLQIPAQFVSRIGELSKANLLRDTMEGMDGGQRVLSEAEEYEWGIGEGRIPELMIPVVNDQVRRGIEFKFIISEEFSSAVGSSAAKNVEIRGLPYVPASVVVTEKEAAICFRFAGGRMDYAGFFGKDEAFRGWVRDLFLHYWERAKRF